MQVNKGDRKTTFNNIVCSFELFGKFTYFHTVITSYVFQISLRLNRKEVEKVVHAKRRTLTLVAMGESSLISDNII